MKKKVFFMTGILIVFLAGVFSPALNWGQEEGETPIALEAETAGETLMLDEEVPVEDREVKGKKMSVFQLIAKGGIVGYLIILLSVIALGLVIDYAVTIRKVKLAPPRDAALLRNLIRDQKFEEIK